jgi:hypothetical protein
MPGGGIDEGKEGEVMFCLWAVGDYLEMMEKVKMVLLQVGGSGVSRRSANLRGAWGFCTASLVPGPLFVVCGPQSHKGAGLLRAAEGC